MMASWPTIEKIALYSPTKMNVTDDGYRDLNGPVAKGRWDYHVGGQAVDFAVPMTDEGQRQMREFAKWWAQFSGYLTELIHSTPFLDDRGFYVKDKVLRDQGFFDSATENAHLNHVHVAIKDADATALLNFLQNKYGPPGNPNPNPVPPAPTVPAPPETNSNDPAWDAAFSAGWNAGFNPGFQAGFQSGYKAHP